MGRRKGKSLEEGGEAVDYSFPGRMLRNIVHLAAGWGATDPVFFQEAKAAARNSNNNSLSLSMAPKAVSHTAHLWPVTVL